MAEGRFALASASATRARLLRAAGLAFDITPPDLDENEVKAGLRAKDLAPRAQALALAECKALAVSRTRPGLVLGADQMLSLDGLAFDKPRDRAQARTHLLALRGRTHELMTAAVVAAGENIVWRIVDAPRLTMRPFSDAFMEHYLDEAGEGALMSVGGYQLESLGAQLFERVEGDFFSVLGLPLLPFLAFLREQGAALS